MTAEAGPALPPEPAAPRHHAGAGPRPGGDTGADAPRWGLGDALAGYVVALFIEVLLVGIASGIAGENSLLTLGAGLVGLWVGLVGAVVYAAKVKGSGSVVLDFGVRIKGIADVVVGFVVGILSQYLMVWLIYVPIILLWPEVRDKLEAPAKDVTGRAHGPLAVTVLVLLVAIGAPIVEELFFRGLLLRALTRRLGAVWGIVFSSVLFGMAHFELLQLPALVAFGVVLGIMANRTGRIGPGIVAHMAFNAVTVISLVAAH